MRTHLAAIGIALVATACGTASESPASTPSGARQSAAAPHRDCIAEPRAIAHPDVDGVPPSEGWVEAASFGADGTIETVNDVVEAPFGLLAAGVHIRTRNLNVFGELPQEGRIWLSSDGTSWEDVTPDGVFADASVNRLVVLPDGEVVAFVKVNAVDPVSGNPTQAYAEWETVDGRTWTDADISHGPRPVYDIVQGGRGYLAATSAEFRSQLMHSGDGRTFVEVADDASTRIARGLGAGPEGFVVIAQGYESAESAAAYASGNGTEWFKATTPDWNPVGVAPLGADWVVAEAGPPLDGDRERGGIPDVGLGKWAGLGGVRRNWRFVTCRCLMGFRAASSSRA